MSSTGKMLGLCCLLFVFCLMTEARRGAVNRVHAPQKQTMVDMVPMNGSSSLSGSMSSESSESSETDSDNDVDTATNDAAAPAAGVGAPVQVAGGNQVAGNMLPNTRARDQNVMFGRASGSSGQAVGIAVAVVGLVAVVVAGAVFAIRRQRRANFA
ncbi:uncharacterized protein LOC105440560 [Strongylocentrotus purpuratus]|uniref:Uncharacterized protein n=1 Tax=Strongylocentrotus purpuratus TaxID=7668 RepID=A0A7M7HL71_STRPU|nr:uncharacterized protein LOC105440560 [Strongylocentrotus purpuratus]|eukprot:XP_011669165.1 PREDICTED: uncharacterized protein LOC105440560 [Strongylocentrotus purpuratus]